MWEWREKDGWKHSPPPVVVSLSRRVVGAARYPIDLFPFWAIHTPVQAENTVPLAPHGTFYRLSQISHRPIRPSTQSGPPNPKTRLQCLFPRRSPQPVDPPERLFQPRVVSP